MNRRLSGKPDAPKMFWQILRLVRYFEKGGVKYFDKQDAVMQN